MKKTILLVSLYFIMLFCLTACSESELEFNQYTIPENVIVTENTTKDVYINSILEDFQENKLRSSWTLAIKKEEPSVMAKEKMMVYEFKNAKTCKNTYNKLLEEYLSYNLAFGYKGKLLFIRTGGIVGVSLEDSEFKEIFSIELNTIKYTNLIIDTSYEENIKILNDYSLKLIDTYDKYNELLVLLGKNTIENINEESFNEYYYLAIQVSCEEYNDNRNNKLLYNE